MKQIIVMRTDMEEMPDNCKKHCPFKSGCKQFTGAFGGLRPDDCPLQEMPTREEAKKILDDMEGEVYSMSYLDPALIDRYLVRLGYKEEKCQ